MLLVVQNESLSVVLLLWMMKVIALYEILHTIIVQKVLDEVVEVVEVAEDEVDDEVVDDEAVVQIQVKKVE
jgi:hypothetical protein